MDGALAVLRSPVLVIRGRSARAISATLLAVLLMVGCVQTDDHGNRLPWPDLPAGPLPEVTPLGPTATSPSGDVVVQQFDVDGAIVTTRTALQKLPERASVVRFTSTLTDSQGGAFQLCIEDVEESVPPSCGGPFVVGLTPGGWTETEAGVTWGDREVVVSWPPLDGELELIEDAPADRPAGELLDELPAGSYDRAALEAVSDEIEAAGLFGSAGPVTYTAIETVPGRLEVGLVVVDLDMVRRVLQVVDRPDALHLVGEAEVLE